MDTREVQAALVKCGWPIAIDGVEGNQTRQAVSDFQAMYTPATLVVDGIAGPMTQLALDISVKLDGHASTNYRYEDFATPDTKWIRGDRKLILGLEKLTERLGRRVNVISGYRSIAHNSAVKGARNSQHIYGRAADMEQVFSSGEVLALNIFSGIGIRRLTDRVAHVDVRPGLSSPAIWYYEG